MHNLTGSMNLRQVLCASAGGEPRLKHVLRTHPNPKWSSASSQSTLAFGTTLDCIIHLQYESTLHNQHYRIGAHANSVIRLHSMVIHGFFGCVYSA